MYGLMNKYELIQIFNYLNERLKENQLNLEITFNKPYYHSKRISDFDKIKLMY